MDVKTRLTEFLSYKGLSQTKFEKSARLGNGFVNNIGDSIRKKSIEKILDVFPDLNVSWLLTGEGKMVKGQVVEDPDYSEQISKLIETTIRQQAQINIILKTVESLAATASKTTVSLVSGQMLKAAEIEADRLRAELIKP